MTKVIQYKNLPEAIIVMAFIAVVLAWLFGSGCVDDGPAQELTPAQFCPVDADIELWTPVDAEPYSAAR